jgi:hypothetical protein
MTEAERLAKELEEDFNLSYPSASMYEAAAELLRLHAINAELIHWMKYIQAQTHVGHIHDTASAALEKAKQ